MYVCVRARAREREYVGMHHCGARRLIPLAFHSIIPAAAAATELRGCTAGAAARPPLIGQASPPIDCLRTGH